MQERVGSGVLIIALAGDRSPFSCFKWRRTELQKLLNMQDEILLKKIIVEVGVVGYRFVYWWVEGINLSYVIMGTMVWEMFAFAAVYIWDFVVLEEQLFSVSMRGLFFPTLSLFRPLIWC